MQIISDKEEMLFKQEKENRRFYSIGLSRKDKNGNYINGYITVVFKKDVDIPNKTKIKIKEAWLGFNIKDKITYPHIFINDFDIVEQPQESNPYKDMSIKTEFDFGEQIKIEDSDLPF